jgi:hypothetical protein
MNRIVMAILAAMFTCAGTASGAGEIIPAQAQTPQACTMIYLPVCGTDRTGKRVTYSNDCFARVAKATNVTPGECPK